MPGWAASHPSKLSATSTLDAGHNPVITALQYAFVGLLAIAGSTMMALQWLLLVVLPAAAAECQAAAVIVSPGARVDSGREVKLSDAGGTGCEACWELTHPALAPIGGCFEAGTTVDVALPANGGYVARLRLRDVATQAVVAEAERCLLYTSPSPRD